MALWSKASPLSPSIKHHGVVCRLDSRKPNKLYTRLRYALIETFSFASTRDIITILFIFNFGTKGRRILLQFSYKFLCGEPHFHVLKFTLNPNLERHGDDCIPYLSPTQLAWLLFFSNIFSLILLLLYCPNGNTNTPISSFFFFSSLVLRGGYLMGNTTSAEAPRKAPQKLSKPRAASHGAMPRPRNLTGAAASSSTRMSESYLAASLPFSSRDSQNLAGGSNEASEPYVERLYEPSRRLSRRESDYVRSPVLPESPITNSGSHSLYTNSVASNQMRRTSSVMHSDPEQRLSRTQRCVLYSLATDLVTLTEN